MSKEEDKNIKYDLEKRLIDFAVRIINVADFCYKCKNSGKKQTQK